MGFRSTFTTSSLYIQWPTWFRTKYEASCYIPQDAQHSLASKTERKTYTTWENLPEDIQTALNELNYGYDLPFILVYLHECGGITRVQIEKDHIYYSEPLKWQITEKMTHAYCYGCSDITKPA